MAKMITNKDKLKVGDCIVGIKNKYTGAYRYASGSVSPVPYKKGASKKIKQKYGKNLVYVIYRDGEEIVGYYQ